MTDKLMCQCCEKNWSVGVFNALGPISLATCQECLDGGLYPYWNLIGYFCGLPYDHLVPEAHAIIETNLKFHNRTLDEFKADCQKSYEEWSATLAKYEQDLLGHSEIDE